MPVSVTPGATRVPIDPRPGAEDVLRCPWLRQSPENGCDATCAACRTRHVDLSRAPFRLLAIVNRTDLATSAACGTNGGELRFVYGAADPDTLRALPFTVIFEYGITLRLGETLRDWAAAWHQLGALAVGSAAYDARLDDVVSQALARATLRRVLTNENAFGAAGGLPWEMRQFVPALTDSGTVRLVGVAMSGTPRLTLAESPELGQWIDDNASAVLANDNRLPASMLAASAPIPSSDFAWRTTARNADAGAAFNRNTCNGCHGGRSSPMDVRFQHVAPPIPTPSTVRLRARSPALAFPVSCTTPATTTSLATANASWRPCSARPAEPRVSIDDATAVRAGRAVPRGSPPASWLTRDPIADAAGVDPGFVTVHRSIAAVIPIERLAAPPVCGEDVLMERLSVRTARGPA